MTEWRSPTYNPTLFLFDIKTHTHGSLSHFSVLLWLRLQFVVETSHYIFGWNIGYLCLYYVWPTRSFITSRMFVWVIIVILFLPSVAGTPTGVTANRIGYTSASVSWTAPSTGTPPAGYEVFYQLTGGGSIVSGGNTSNTELTLTGLTLGNYSIFVVGYGAVGEPVLPSARSKTANIMIGKIIPCVELTDISCNIIYMQIFPGCNLP